MAPHIIYQAIPIGQQIHRAIKQPVMPDTAATIDNAAAFIIALLIIIVGLILLCFSERKTK
ncbi:hypothetical protein FGL85_07410 [Leuconostoc pseudomesenteroides]|uniref:Uncharacterized protein n=1 Tax=Leuconostoc pseudomesenteroides TaxID=33968 RepID=A0A5B8T084_LEUPS|nr:MULTISPECIES: hypothetical protein [Leuconostoc]MBK0040756.1 hypothetical protein [Leuconostoc sp. S51]MBK0051822.1 hypothetical protein [Leuconostoc sp. S50]MCT4380342.1 hypothetical protein [Leuconostoc pseudomesenteroides]QEA42346.1 hypothetical protein FGL85_07410 [Leuconostoc pseudomesenteroides]